MRRELLSILLLLVVATALLYSIEAVVSVEEPLYLVIIWHYHQPWYLGHNDSYFILPWVRLHTVGNYFKMAYIVSKYPDIKVVFTFSGSLLNQIELYLRGLMDERQVLSLKVARGEKLSDREVYDIVKIPGGFFDINWNRVVDVVPRYRALRDYTQSVLAKYRYLPDTEMVRAVAKSFSDQDIVDIATLFNLFWIDPEVLRDMYPDLYSLRRQALETPDIHFTREQLARVLEAQKEIMRMLVPTYKSLLGRGIEIIPVPYSHPLAPIIADFGWTEDLYIHTTRSIELFREYLNYTPAGVWPAEQAVNEYVIEVFARENMTWSVSDESVLSKSGVDVGRPQNLYSLWYIDVAGRRLYMLFRDTTLSNLISFEYSRWRARDAVEDLVRRLLDIRERAGPGAVVTIALDGENPWENYEEFGDLFLNTLYQRLTELQRQGLIKTVTGREAVSLLSGRAREIPYGERLYLDLAGRDISDIPRRYSEDAYPLLPRRKVMTHLAEGSWAGGELTPWIGQREENAAWMWLARAREDLLKTLGVSTLREALARNPRAVEYLLRSEASDWFWWYGGEFGRVFPVNTLYKTYLRGVYEALGLRAPDYLYTSFNPDATPVGVLNTETPRPMERPPTIDGVIGAGEWRGSLNMSIGSLFLYGLVGVDTERLYIALVPSSREVLENRSIEVSIYTTTPWRSVSPYHPGYNSFPRYTRTDLGIGLFSEIRLRPSTREGAVYAADGSGGWTLLYILGGDMLAVGEVVEVSVPWLMLGLAGGDTAYIAVAVYVDRDIVETSSRTGLVYQVVVPTARAPVQANVVVDIRDPEGDDRGPGTYVYPTADVFRPGVFDMTEFRVLDTGDRVLFEVYVRDLGGNPWNGPNGFCLQYVQIYIRTTLDLPSRNDTFGLNIYIAENSSWHIALLLAPGWGSDPVPKGERAAIYYYNGSYVVQDRVFRVYADVSRNAIVAEVDKSLLFDTENMRKWVYTVALTSYDGYGPDRVRPVGVEAGTWVVGAGTGMAQAILRGVEPRVMDLLAPTAEDQYRMLSSYRVSPEPMKAVVWGINYSLLEEVSRRPLVYTTTLYINYTRTHTETIEKTGYTTIVQTVSRTATETIERAPVVYTASLVAVGVVVGVVITLGLYRVLRRQGGGA